MERRDRANETIKMDLVNTPLSEPTLIQDKDKVFSGLCFLDLKISSVLTGVESSCFLSISTALLSLLFPTISSLLLHYACC